MYIYNDKSEFFLILKYHFDILLLTILIYIHLTISLY